jgi:flagellar hook-associated protein 3 FlgL
MIPRVASFAVSEQMIDAALRAQSVMANDQLQEASGQISTEFGGLGSTTRQVLDLQVATTRAQSYIDNATAADSKIQVMYSTMGSVSSLLTQFRSTLASYNSSMTNTSSITTSAQQMMQEVGSLLNTQYGGDYLFSGSRVDTTPVDLSSSVYPPASSPSSPDTSYYQGDDSTASVRVSATQVVSYGVTADNSAFEQGLRALNLIASSGSLDSTTVNEAMALAQNALEGVGSLQAQVGQASSAIENASALQTQFKSDMTTVTGNLTGVDVAAVTAQLSTYQAQLTASYAAISKVQSLNLADYLR